MLEAIAKGFAKIFGTKSEKDLKVIRPRVAEINQAFAKLRNLSDDDLRKQTAIFKQLIIKELAEITQKKQDLRNQVDENPDLDLNAKDEIFSQIDRLDKEEDKKLETVLWAILPEAFAVVKETARRFKENEKLTVEATDFDREIAKRRRGVEMQDNLAIWHNRWEAAGVETKWEMMHYDVQLIGGMVLHQGKIAEMATGEGKTLVATLPAYLNALAGKGVHIVTVNDYLAKRDSEWMAPLFEFHGMWVDCIDKHEPNTFQRRNAYAADITYGTNNEFGFDYLRDNMVHSPNELVQRKLHYAMVDEVDSVLIDDARTPLIISGPVPRGGEDQAEFEFLKPRVVKLVETQRKLVNNYLSEAKKKLEQNSNDSEGGLSLFRAYRGLPKNKPLIKYLSETGIKQKLQKVENYYLQDNSKLMPEADEPLYFTIDEKHNSIELTDNGINLITEQGEDTEFFVLPNIGAKLAEIEKDKSLSEEEMLLAKDQVTSDYAIKTRRIHVVTQLLKAFTLFERDVDYILQEGKVKIVDEQTGRVLDGRRYSDGLHQALEAKESVKIEDGTQTYATVTLQNYFRMYHKLAGMTGTAETEAAEFWDIYKLDVVVIPTNVNIARKDEEDKVYKTTREKFNAVANEIQELTSKGRPVLVGTTSVEISELLSRMLKMKGIEHQVLNAKQHAKEAEVVANAGRSGTVTIATNMAGRGTDIKLSPESKAAGGLAIIGTERHESRRVDRQLRGRAGRQGDPGSSQFFVSLEDSLMRLFGSDRIASVMDRMGLEEGEVIQHSMITSSIERAQKKVEENNFGMRKRLLEYDDVMNMQREVIYKRRRHALFGERLSLDIQSMFYEVAYDIAERNHADWESLKVNIVSTFGMVIPLDEVAKKDAGTVAERIYEVVYKHYLDHKQFIENQALGSLQGIIEQAQGRPVEVSTYFTDGRKNIHVACLLQDIVLTKGKALGVAMEQAVVLALVDLYWKEHLREMDDLRQQVSFAYLEQKDPLQIYKKEAFNLFSNFIGHLNDEITSFLLRTQLPQGEAQMPVQEQSKPKPAQKPKYKEYKQDAESTLGSNQAETEVMEQERPKIPVTKPIVSQKITNRNDKVTVRYPDGTVKTDKYKKLEEDIRANKCVVIEG